MQEIPAVQLGFDSPEFLGADLPANINGKAISEALSKSVAAIIESGFSPSSKSFDLRVIVHCGQNLLQMRKPNEAYYLVEGAKAKYRNRPSIAMIALKSLGAVSRTKQIVEKSSELLSAPNLDPNAAKKYVALLRRSNLHHMVEGSPDKFRHYFGDIETYLDDPFGQIEKLVTSNVYDLDRSSKRVMELRGLSTAREKRDFLFRRNLGFEFYAMARFVQICAMKAMRAGPSGLQTSEGKLILALWSKLRTLISAESYVSMGEAISRTGPNRSLIFAQSHSGLSVQLSMSREHFPIPVSAVGNGVSNSPDDPSFHLRTGAESTVRDFAKLVKLSKREPRIVRIFPDGQHGEPHTASLFGKPFQMGRGAQTLAYLGKAATIFGAYRYCDQKFTLELFPGPDPLEFDSMGAYELAFGDFYTSCLERIILGPPEDIGLGATFWRLH